MNSLQDLNSLLTPVNRHGLLDLEWEGTLVALNSSLSFHNSFTTVSLYLLDIRHI